MTTDLRERLATKFPGYFEEAYYEKEDTNLGDELLSFIATEKQRTREETLKEVLGVVPEAEYIHPADRNTFATGLRKGHNLCREACIAAITGLKK